MHLSNMSENEYSRFILKRINTIMSSRNLKQLDLSKKTNISQSTLSKLLKGEMKLTLQHIFKLSKALNIAPSELLSLDDTTEIVSDLKEMNIFHEFGVINERYLNEQIFIRDVKHPAFKGYLNNELFFYCYPTISSESKILEGKISFEESENCNYCQAKLILSIGKTDSERNNIYKEYLGELIVSLTMGSCYIILINSEIGEILTLNFKHAFFFNQELTCRVGAMTSTSSGVNKLPVMQRALISKHKLHVNEGNNDDSEFVRGQLRLNDSNILIPEETYKTLLDEAPSTYKDFFNKCDKYFLPISYKVVDESKLRDIDVSSDIKVQGISMFRNLSVNPKYNKVSTRTDEFTFQYIDSKLNN